MIMHEKCSCPECGKQIDSESFIMECDYCLSKREE